MDDTRRGIFLSALTEILHTVICTNMTTTTTKKKMKESVLGIQYSRLPAMVTITDNWHLLYGSSNSDSSSLQQDIFNLLSAIAQQWHLCPYHFICCLIYIYRVQAIATPPSSSTRVRMDRHNWQALIVTSLLICHKYWDDDECRNKKQTKLLRFDKAAFEVMEMAFVTHVDYDLNVDIQQYEGQWQVIENTQRRLRVIKSQQLCECTCCCCMLHFVALWHSAPSILLLCRYRTEKNESSSNNNNS